VVKKHSQLQVPSHFIGIFGDPVGPPRKDRIEDGRYIPHINHWPSAIKAGDMILLYCTSSYSGHEQEGPGIGIVLSADTRENAIHYRYLPFEQPITMNAIRSNLLPGDRVKFENRRFSTFWIFEIERSSFKILADPLRLNRP